MRSVATRAQVFSVSMKDDAFLIATEQMGHAGGKKHTAAGGARGAESIHHDMNLIDRFPDHDECVGQGCEQHDCRSMLVVVHDRDVQRGLEATFDLETARCTDIFEIDGAESRRDGLHRSDDFVRILRVQADGPGIDSCQFLERA